MEHIYQQTTGNAVSRLHTAAFLHRSPAKLLSLAEQKSQQKQWDRGKPKQQMNTYSTCSVDRMEQSSKANPNVAPGHRIALPGPINAM